jgi:hypothetical protein
MPNNTLIFLRHAETQVDKNQKQSRWDLSQKGREDASKIAKLDILQDIDIILSFCDYGIIINGRVIKDIITSR